MADNESPAAHYRRLAQECLESARAFPAGDQRDVLLQMAQVWQRLADQYTNSTMPSFGLAEGKRPVVQQQQQVQPKDDKKK